MMTQHRWTLVIVVALAGCGEGENESEVTAPTSPVASATSESSSQEPVSFESLAIATDSSYVSPPAGEGAQPGEVREFTKLKIRCCWCPAGTFQLGSSGASEKHLLNEGPCDVTLSQGFWMQQTELTQEQYKELMGANPSFYQGAQNPVDSVTWTEATEFCRRLSELPPEKAAGNLFRLPTEAEWEYACRAGSTTEYSFGDDAAELGRYAWFSGNAERTTHPVGQKEANAWGLHDMHGNVAEWCQDYYGAYPEGAATDPRGPESGERRTLRGGGWFFDPMFARSAHRDAYTPSARYVGLGFRLVATRAAESAPPATETGSAEPNER